MLLRRFGSTLRALVVGALVVQLVLPPGPASAQVATSGTLAANPSSAFAGDTVTFSGMVQGGRGVTFTLNFGDGNAAQVPTPPTPGVPGTYSLTHVYAAGRTSATATLVASTGPTLARAVVTLGTGTLTPPAGAILMTVPATFTVTSTVVPAGQFFSIGWGDGTANTRIPVAASTPVAHTYANAGTYTASLIDPSGVTISTTTVSVAALGLTGSAAPNPVQAGTSTTFTFTATSRAGYASAPTVTVAYGDGQTATFTYGPAIAPLAHTYARAGNYTATATVGTTQLASIPVSVVTATFALATNPNPSLAGTAVTITTTATVPAGAVPPRTLTLAYGDGSANATIPFTSATYAHTYAARGSFTLSAIDPNGVSYATATQTVVAPGATVSAPNGTVGQPVTVTVGVTALGGLAGPNLVVSFGDGAQRTIAYASMKLTHVYATAGTYAISVAPVLPNGGVGPPYATTSTTISAPTVGLTSAPNPALAGSTVTYTLTAANGAGALTVAFGDGTTQTVPFANATLTHAYAAAGAYSVTVTSAAGGATLASLTETIVAPSATLSANPNPATAGTATTISLAVGSLGGLAGPSLVLNFGDGSAAQTVPYAATSLQHTYAAGGTFAVTVTPVGGTTPLATLSLPVTSAATVTLASSPNPSLAGAAVTVVVTASGPGRGSLYVSFGDGSAPQAFPFGSTTLTHAYAAAGTYPIAVSATAGGPAIYSISQTVVALGATLAPSQNPTLAGTQVSFALGVASLGGLAAPMLTVNYGDGTVQNVPYAAATLTHTYAAAGQYTVLVTAPGVAAPLATVAMTVMTPMVSLAATPNPQFAGKPVAVALTVNALAGNLAPSLVVDYGDGSTPASVPFAAASLSHTYLVAGNFTIAVKAAGSGAVLYSLPVQIVSPSATLGATPNPVLVQSPVSFALGVGSLGGLAGPNLTVNYGDGSAPQTLPYAATTLTHTYATAGTYAVSIVAAGSTTLLASISVVVEAPTASISVAPNPQLVGAPVSVALTVVALAKASGRAVLVTPPNLTIDYGDGSGAQTIPYASATLTHSYAGVGTYAIRVTDPTGSVNATGSVQIVAPGATLLIAPNPVMVGNATGITVMVSALGNLPAPTPLTVAFGDGTTQQIAYATATIQHTYANVGTYNVTVTTPAGAVFAQSTATVVQQSQSLLVQTPAVNAGQPAQIMVSLVPPGGFSANPVLLLFGDGTQTTVRATGLYPHAYGAPGIYTVTLQSLATGATLQTQRVTVNGIAPRVPIGQIFGTTFTLSPVLAGDQTQVIVQFSIAVPTLASTADPIEAYVDLTTTKGKLVRRSDLFEILPALYSGPGVKQVKIPYDTPIDAAGTYLVKVTLMSAEGGTITTGSPATLIIIGGPDPVPKLTTDLHGTGAIEIGPHAGEPGVTFDPALTNALLLPTYSVGLTGLFDPVSHRPDPVLTVKSGAQSIVRGPDQTPPPVPPGSGPQPQVGATIPAAPQPSPPGPLAGGAINGSAAYAGSLDNVKPPPSAPAGVVPTPMPEGPAAPGVVGTAPPPTALPQGLTAPTAFPQGLTPAAGPPATATPAAAIAPAQTVAAPTAVGVQASPAHPFQEILGRGSGTLPALLGGNTTLRGFDAVDSTGVGPTTYQLGYGYTSLGTATTSAERGTIADIARSFDGTGIARVTYFGRQDDPVEYANTTNGTGPLVANAEVFEFTSPALGPLTLSATGGLSEAHSLVQGYRTDDAADKVALTFVEPKYNFSFDYHNAGSLFAVGGGEGAASDRVGFASASTIQLYTVATLALGYTKDETRSAFSRQSDAFATMNFTLPKQATFQIGVRRDTQLTPTSDTDSDTGNFTFGGHVGIATLALNGSLTATRDYIDAINGTTTRTLSAQFAVQQNAHALGIGINATDLSGASPNETLGESLTYGFPFLGHLQNGALVHGLELQMSATNASTHTPTSGADDEGLAAILSYHVNSHLAVGVRNEYTWHRDETGVGSNKASALRLRLDLTQ